MFSNKLLHSVDARLELFVNPILSVHLPVLNFEDRVVGLCSIVHFFFFLQG